MSGVTGVTGVTGTSGTSGTTDQPTTQLDGKNTQLDRTAFLKLLVAQLKYQDPTNPADTSQMLTQSAQLTMVDRLNEIATSMTSSVSSQQLALGSSMIGKQVTFLDETLASTKKEFGEKEKQMTGQISELTATPSEPSGTTILPTLPSSTASTSMVALSVSISAITSPAATESPSFLTHLESVPSSMVGESAGIRISTGMTVPSLSA